MVDTKYYSSVSLFINGSLLWHIDGHFTSDYILGITCIGMPLTKYSGYFIVKSGNREITLSRLKDLDKLGGFISYENKTISEALKCSDIKDINMQCELRDLQPDDGTNAVWVFDHNDNYNTKWNLIMTDCAVDFISGFKLICEAFQVNMWDYILDQPIGSEGSVGSWENLLKYRACDRDY